MRLLFALLLTGCGKPVPPPSAAGAPVPVNGIHQKLEALDEKYLHYAIATHIDAPLDIVWGLLTNADAFPEWNRTVTSLKGPIALDQRLELRVRVDEKRTFKPVVVEMSAPHHMVWADGNKMFHGERTYRLTERDGGTDFTMKEVFTGSMLKMIAPKLPDFGPEFEAYAEDLKAEAERRKSS